MRRVLCNVIVDSEIVESHFFNLPEFGEPHFYRMVTSFSAFHTFGKNRYERPSWTWPRLWATMRNEVVVDSDLKFENRIREMQGRKPSASVIHEVPTYEHNTIYEVYQAIGYDRKRHRLTLPIEYYGIRHA